MDVTPLSQDAYKVQLAGVAVKRALLNTLERCRAGIPRHEPIRQGEVEGLYVETVPDPTVPPGNDRLFWCNRRTPSVRMEA